MIPQKNLLFRLYKVVSVAILCYTESGGNWVTTVGGRVNTPYFVSPQRNSGTPDSSLALGLQYEQEA